MFTNIHAITDILLTDYKVDNGENILVRIQNHSDDLSCNHSDIVNIYLMQYTDGPFGPKKMKKIYSCPLSALCQDIFQIMEYFRDDMYNDNVQVTPNNISFRMLPTPALKMVVDGLTYTIEFGYASTYLTVLEEILPALRSPKNIYDYFHQYYTKDILVNLAVDWKTLKARADKLNKEFTDHMLAAGDPDALRWKAMQDLKHQFNDEMYQALKEDAVRADKENISKQRIEMFKDNIKETIKEDSPFKNIVESALRRVNNIDENSKPVLDNVEYQDDPAVQMVAGFIDEKTKQRMDEETKTAFAENRKMFEEKLKQAMASSSPTPDEAEVLAQKSFELSGPMVTEDYTKDPQESNNVSELKVGDKIGDTTVIAIDESNAVESHIGTIKSDDPLAVEGFDTPDNPIND